MSDDAEAIYAALISGMLVFSIIGLAMVVFAVIIYWKIFSKAGYSGAMGLLMFVPIANIIVLCILAFGEWPIHRELNHLRQQVMGPPQGFPPAGYTPHPPYR